MKRLLRRLIDEIGDDGLFDAAAGVAFWLLLSMPAALLTALSAVSLLGEGLTGELRTSMIEFVERTFADQADTLTASIDSLFDQTRPGVLSLSIAVAVFTLSRGFAGLIRALDTVYDVEETRNFVHTRALGIGLAIGTLATVAVSTALWSYGSSAGVPTALLLVIGTLVLVGWAATMFHVGPNHHTPWRYDLPGAAITAVGWFLLSAGFRWYVGIVGNGNQFVGATGAVLLGLTWLWAACSVFLIGGEINQLLAARAGVIAEGRSIVGHVRSVAAERNWQLGVDMNVLPWRDDAPGDPPTRRPGDADPSDDRRDDPSAPGGHHPGDTSAATPEDDPSTGRGDGPAERSD